mgnify:CR=1 FL=1
MNKTYIKTLLFGNVQEPIRKLVTAVNVLNFVNLKDD